MLGLINDFKKLNREERELRLRRDILVDLIEKEVCCDFGSSKSIEVEACKVTVNKPIDHSFDLEKWRKIKSSIDKALRPERIITELDERAYQFLEENEKEVFVEVSRSVISTPGKVEITIEAIDDVV